MHNKVFTFVVVLAVAASPAFAQGVPSYLADESDSAVRVEVSIPELEPKTFWQKIQSLIGIRGQGRYRPEIGTTFTVQSSAYASSPYQTDSTPCITAAGTRVRPGVVASNFLPIGTVLEINKEKYIVEDRMNARYKGYFLDIWFPSTSSALEFGRKNLEITVLGYSEAGTDIRKLPAESAKPIEINEANEITLWQSVREGVGNLTRFLSARVNPSVNRYDVDCLSEEQ